MKPEEAVKKQSRKNRIGVIIFILIVAAVAAYFVLSSAKPKTEEAAPPAVVIQKPAIDTVVEGLTISGYVEAKAMIPVVPFVSGTITEYPVMAGDFVTKDTVIAKIDDAAYRQQMLQAQAAYFGYESTFSRVESLYKSGSTTQQNYDSAKAQRDAAKAQYDLAQLQLDYTEVKAPVDGTILIADQAVGSIGTQTTPLVVIADLNDLVIRLKVPEKYFDLFQLQKDSIVVTVTRPAQKDLYEDAVSSCTIENIAPYISAESKNFQVVCHIDNPGERFRPGMYVKVSAAYQIHENVPTIPITARKLDGAIYTYNPEDNKVYYHDFSDVITDTSHLIVPEELKNEYFVVDGITKVFDGQVVNVISGKDDSGVQEK